MFSYPVSLSGPPSPLSCSVEDVQYACMPIAWLVFMLAWAWKKGLDMTWGSLQSTQYTATADTQQTKVPILLLSSTVSHHVWLLKGHSDEIFDSRLVLCLNQYISHDYLASAFSNTCIFKQFTNIFNYKGCVPFGK